MPDGAKTITALSWSEVQSIVDRFESLNPYNPELIPGSILNVHKLNRGSDKQRRQLFGYSIAAKRYALYTKTPNDIEIVEPKAHGLGYFYPPKDSREGWDRDVPQWIFEAWDWIMRGVLGLKRTRPAWFDGKRGHGDLHGAGLQIEDRLRFFALRENDLGGESSRASS